MLPLPTFLVLLYISISYVLPLYATSQPERSKRDNPRTIKSRMQKLTILLVFNLLFVPFLQSQLSSTTSPISFKDAFFDLGIIPGYYTAIPNHWQFGQFVKDLGKCVILIVTLYCGPVLDFVLYHLLTPKSSILEDFYHEFLNIWSFRNFIFAPITEEIFYTSMLLTTYLNLIPHSQLSYQQLYWQPSLFFGLAHAHHAYEQFQEGSMTTVSILLTTCFQIQYTTLFGGLTKFVFVRTGGNLWCCIVLHALCNLMGFPGPSRLNLHFTVVDKKTGLISKLVSIWNKCYFALLLIGLISLKDSLKSLVGTPGYRVTL
ncbi:hypothetical protein SUVZ_13G4050 [Saccharomyces uvarum]|uniref:intramembrane prenyl-peptidase Rce1 n=1 Tax=Saccharomyces uvarum TaxID=230603 RepID=A0ABN8WMN0_SACUV|nr:hypothetical protein SUVZ_13G4050 [Saccharomyces uvarum]